MELRDYQIAILDKARARMQAGVRSLMITAPTGSGKTAIMAHMMASAAAKGNDSWLIVHRKELVEQASRALSILGVEHGVAASGATMNVWPKVQVCQLQSLRHRVGYLRKPKLIVWDEASHIAATTWRAVFEENRQAFHIGLSATPWRLSGEPLSPFFSELVLGPSVADLIEQGYLSKFKIFAPPGADLAGVHVKMGDYVKSELVAVVDKPTITGSAIEHYKRLADGKRAIIFCVNIEHSRNVVGSFRAAGIIAEHVDGDTDAGTRKKTIADFSSGKIKVLSNVDLFTYGFDLPSIEVGLFLRPSMSLAVYLQQCGRVLRPFSGKDHAIILDHVGNVARHGFPDEPREWSLNSTRNTRKVRDVSSPGVTICPACFAGQSFAADRCAYCGHAFPIKAREIEEVDGELVELQRAAAVRERKIQQGGARTLEDLIALGRSRGYRKPEAWGLYVFNARKGRKGK